MSGDVRLDRLYDVPASVTARLVGGPFDGEERPFPAALLRSVCPRLVGVVPSQGLLMVSEGAGPPRRLQQAVYEALRDANGFFSRDDRGQVRFDYWGLQ